MIKYALKCPDGHQFESWFQNSAAYDKLREAGHLACAICGATKVEKAIMSPRVNVPAKSQETDNLSPLSQPLSTAEVALKELREKIEANSDNVGTDFAQEARAIHNGEAPVRSIIGEAKPMEAKKLLDDGIPVAPLPWNTQKTN